MYDNNNVFAKIINKTIPAIIIYEDDDIIAFKDVHPVAPVHIIAIPKKEYTDYSNFILTASGDEIKNYFTKLAYVASLVGISEDGYRLITNNGSKAGQTILHFHFHIIGGKTLSTLI